MIELNNIYQGCAAEVLKGLDDNSVDCCVTSPPYYGLRDYKVKGQIGQESTPEQYISSLVQVFTEVYRVMKPTGTLWINIGDSYWGSGGASGHKSTSMNLGRVTESYGASRGIASKKSDIYKPKDLIGIPWMLAFALRSAGWYLRQEIIWAKKNCMPESVKDRCTRSHEFIFMLSKSARYYYDADAIKEPAIYDIDGTGTAARKARQNTDNKLVPISQHNGIRAFKDASKMNGKHREKQRGHSQRHAGFNDRWDKMTTYEQCTGMRNKRDVWHIAPAQFPEAHFATFPEEIPALCTKAGCPENGTVLDPFMGAGTTALVARKLNRNYIGAELNPDYIRLAEARIKKELGMFN